MLNRDDGRGWTNGRAASFLNPNSKNDSELLRRRESNRDINRLSTINSSTSFTPLSTSSPSTTNLSANSPPNNILIPNGSPNSTLSSSYSGIISNGYNSISKRTKSIDLNGNASPPPQRTLETSVSDRSIIRKEPPPLPVKQAYSASCIGLTNYAYPVVNVKKKEEGEEEGDDAPQEADQNEAVRAQRREQLRKQRDALNWSWEHNINNNNNSTNNNNNINNINNSNGLNGIANTSSNEYPGSAQGKAMASN
jgi:hypothetical protein